MFRTGRTLYDFYTAAVSYLLQRHRRVPFFSRSSLAFIVCSRFDYCRYVGFQVIPLCNFDLQFSNAEPWREPFYVMKFFFFHVSVQFSCSVVSDSL